jgi:hypothetical protein
VPESSPFSLSKAFLIGREFRYACLVPFFDNLRVMPTKLRIKVRLDTREIFPAAIIPKSSKSRAREWLPKSLREEFESSAGCQPTLPFIEGGQDFCF